MQSGKTLTEHPKISRLLLQSRGYKQKKTHMPVPAVKPFQMLQDPVSETSSALQSKLYLEALSKAPFYLDYQRAFTRGTGLPLALHPPGMIHLVRYCRKQQNGFCALMSEGGTTCAMCYAFQQQLERTSAGASKTLTCFGGLCESVVPVCVDERPVLFLHTGHIFCRPPNRSRFERLSTKLQRLEPELDPRATEQAYLGTRMLPLVQYKSLVHLLELFATQLAVCARKLLFQTCKSEPGVVTRARRFVEAHCTEEVSLSRVASAAGASPPYLSRVFRSTTGVTFVNYIARLRVEKAKTLLQESNSQVSEVALEAGFRSLSQFNRTFKKITGQTPRRFKLRQHPGQAAFK